MKIAASEELGIALQACAEELQDNKKVSRATINNLRSCFKIENDTFVEIHKSVLNTIEKVLSAQKIDSFLAKQGQDAIQSMLSSFESAKTL